MNYYSNNEINVFEPLFNEVFGLKQTLSNEKYGSLSMRTDIRKADKGFVLDIELPGFKKEDIAISYENEYLTIKAKAETLKKNDKGEIIPFVHRERFAGTASRSFYVGEIDEKLVQASFRDGVLTVFVPEEKTEEEVTHQIAIN